MRTRFFAALLSLTFVMALGVGCGPKYPNCDNDEHCAEKGEFCVEKMCRECSDNTQCAAKTGDECMVCGYNNTCETRSGCCHADADCPGGKCWIDGDAKIGTCGGECRGNEHCPAGRVCQGGRCIAPSQGCEAAGCPSGKKCVGGSCVWACEFQSIYFDYNESALTSDGRRNIAQNSECASTIGVGVSVEGHCDERGTDEYNMQLGMRRASSVKRYMGDKGVSSSNMSTISYGEDHPVCNESGENCWWRNRRVEIKVK